MGSTSLSLAVFFVLASAARSARVISNVELNALTSSTGIVLATTTSNTKTGWSVRAAGDVNGDGINDMLVADHYQNNYAGITSVIFGRRGLNSNMALSPTLFTSRTNGFQIVGSAAEQNNAQSGTSVSTAGDFNGDGIGDIIIGSPGANSETGIAYLIYGRNVTLFTNIDLFTFVSSVTLGFRILGASSGDKCGFSVSTAGDFNLDGLDDVIIGAPLADPPSRNGGGMIYIIFGKRGFGTDVLLSTFTTGTALGFRIHGALGNTQYGLSVSHAGDVNNDGISDVIIGSTTINTYVLFGRNASRIGNIDLADVIADPYEGFQLQGVKGWVVDNVGDVNGDTITDLIISYPYTTAATYVIFGRNVTSPATAFSDIFITSMVTGPTTGFRIIMLPLADYIPNSGSEDPGYRYASGAGDVNNDGFDDIILGLPGLDATAPKVNSGRVYIVFGRSTFTDIDLSVSKPSLATGFCYTGALANDQLGHAVAKLGDVNGDGIDDVIVGAPRAVVPSSAPVTLRGAAYVFFGSEYMDNPTGQPSRQPSSQPTRQPVGQPTSQPSRQPSAQPTRQPIGQPTSQPSRAPTSQPSRRPSSQPTGQPSLQPLTIPSSRPSGQPSSTPSGQPTVTPSSRPSAQPSDQPSRQPSTQPSTQPSVRPTCQPSSQPSIQPVASPSSQPSAQPSSRPSTQPSTQPSTRPSAKPTAQPSGQPTSRPSTQPSSIPTNQPSSQPSTQPSAAPSGQPTCQPSSQPSRQPSCQPSRQPSRQPSGQPTRQPSRQPTAEPTILTVIGEWSAVMATTSDGNGAVASGKEALVGSEVWICGDQLSNNQCVVLDAVSGNRVTQFALPWEVVSDVTPIGVTNRVMLRGQSTDSTGTVSTSIASCDISVAELVCDMKSFSNTVFLHTAYAAHLEQLIYVGKSTDYATATVTDASWIAAARNYYYSGSGMRSMMLLRAASPSNFIGSFVAGTSVSTGYVNNIIAGWVHMDSGDLSAMSLVPTSSSSSSSNNNNILNSAELVNAMVLEPLGPDMFIGGALQLSSYNNGERTAYLIRVNSMYLQVKYGVRYKITGVTGGRRRQLRGSSASYSTLQCMTRVNNVLYAVINYARAGQNDTRFSVLKISTANGAIAQQASIYAHNMSVACSDMTSTGLALSLACSVSHNATYTQSLLIAVDTDFTFSRLPNGLQRDKTAVFQAHSVSFTATRLPTVKNNLPITTTDESFVASSNMEFPPTRQPSVTPTVRPSSQPSSAPSSQPSSSPTAAPSVSPQPTSQPSTGGPTNTYKPTVKPTFSPTLFPTLNPTARPSTRPTFHPTNKPTARPTVTPSTDPSLSPSVAPTLAPVSPVTSRPTRVPSIRPSALRPMSRQPTEEPTRLELAAGGLGKGKSGKNDTRDQIIAVTVLGTAWVIGLCLYLYFTHRAADVKKETENTAPTSTLPENVLSSDAVPPPPTILPAPPLVVPTISAPDSNSDNDSSIEVSSLHSSEISDVDFDWGEEYFEFSEFNGEKTNEIGQPM